MRGPATGATVPTHRSFESSDVGSMGNARQVCVPECLASGAWTKARTLESSALPATGRTVTVRLGARNFRHPKRMDRAAVLSPATGDGSGDQLPGAPLSRPCSGTGRRRVRTPVSMASEFPTILANENATVLARVHASRQGKGAQVRRRWTSSWSTAARSPEAVKSFWLPCTLACARQITGHDCQCRPGLAKFMVPGPPRRHMLVSSASSG